MSTCNGAGCSCGIYLQQLLDDYDRPAKSPLLRRVLTSDDGACRTCSHLIGAHRNASPAAAPVPGEEKMVLMEVWGQSMPFSVSRKKFESLEKDWLLLQDELVSSFEKLKPDETLVLLPLNPLQGFASAEATDHSSRLIEAIQQDPALSQALGRNVHVVEDHALLMDPSKIESQQFPRRGIEFDGLLYGDTGSVVLECKHVLHPRDLQTLVDKVDMAQKIVEMPRPPVRGKISVTWKSIFSKTRKVSLVAGTAVTFQKAEPRRQLVQKASALNIALFIRQAQKFVRFPL